MAFAHTPLPLTDPVSDDWLVALAQDKQLARLAPDGAVVLPTWSEIASIPGRLTPPMFVGRLDEKPCWLVSWSRVPEDAPHGWLWSETRALFASATPAQAQACACARQLQWWDLRHRFCGCCGAPTSASTSERVRRCPRCDASFFPSAAPAVIVAITRGDTLLLAHNRNFRSGMFSLLAGFVDPGETLEQAALREVREEVGIEIAGLRYVRSQPWPFPNSLMVGFRASYLSGDIRADGVEITEAGWFTRDTLPDIPRPGTVARELIDAWLRETPTPARLA